MHYRLLKLLPYVICTIFFIAYSTLSIVRHNHYQSFGYDLGINDQVVWEYSKLKTPITTIDHVPFISKLNVHVEFVYALISPFYWIWSDVRMLLILQAGFVSFSGLAIYFLAKYYKLHIWIRFSLLSGYLMFYGVQNALWFDAHSVTFATAFTAWFLYFLVSKKIRWATIFFILAITSKENLAAKTFLISMIYFLVSRKKAGLYFAVASLLYLGLIFGIYFPDFVSGGYRFDNPEGLFSNLNPILMVNTAEKLQVYWYTFLSYGFLSFLNPLYLIPVLGNLASYFVLGSNVSTAQGLFLQYRIGLAPVMSWATIATIAKYKWLNNKNIAVYLILCTLAAQYVLHLPLSYLTKQWFWTEPQAVKNINKIIKYIPNNAFVVAQDNIIPHVSHRDQIYSLYWYKKGFSKNSPCGNSSCDWFEWIGNPQFLLTDISPQWDIRHLLADRNAFIDGVNNLEKAKVIMVYKRLGTATLYKILQKP